MFGYSDKTTLTGFNAYNKKNEFLDYVISFPIMEDIEIPKDIREISIIEGQNESDLQRCKTSFKIYVGQEGSIKEFTDEAKDGNLKFGITFDRGIEPGEIISLKTPICYYVENGVRHIFAKINKGDKVVANIDELKSLLLEISMRFEEYQEAIQGIKDATVKTITMKK